MASNLLRTLGSNAPFVYGTAWKKEATTGHVQDALRAGFKAVDTACQPRHYREELVGQGLRSVYQSGEVKRGDIWVQTKFTSPGGQDPHNMPYNPSAPLSEQVHTSIAVSLHHLRHRDSPSSPDAPDQETYIDCVLLHSPLESMSATLEAWEVLESYVPHQIRHLGVSNISLPQLERLHASTTVKPAVVQNRFYPATRHDVPLRRFCRDHDVVYQSFWTLTGNGQLLRAEPVRSLAEHVAVAAPVALYALVMHLGVVVLNGTTDKAHMTEDLEGVAKVRRWAGENEPAWEGVVQRFRQIIGEGER